MDPNSLAARYKIINPIAQGGMGTVSLGEDRKTGKQVAIKQLLPEITREWLAIRRFKREIKLLCNVRHPRIVQIEDYFLDEDGLAIVMEYVPGGDLAAAINNKQMATRGLLLVYADLVEALAHLHQEGIVHRDLKPSNILITADGRGKLADLGLAVLRQRDSTILTETREFLGTTHYAPLEQKQGARDVDEKADVYSLGLIAYEIWKRQSPYSVVKLDDSGLGRAIETALADNPAERRIAPFELAEALNTGVAECAS